MDKVTFTRVSYKELEKLEAGVQSQIIEVLESCKKDPFKLDCKKLKKPLQGYRIRTGTYRLLCTIESGTITVYAIRHRKDVYKR